MEFWLVGHAGGILWECIRPFRTRFRSGFCDVCCDLLLSAAPGALRNGGSRSSGLAASHWLAAKRLPVDKRPRLPVSYRRVETGLGLSPHTRDTSEQSGKGSHFPLHESVAAPRRGASRRAEVPGGPGGGPPMAPGASQRLPSTSPSDNSPAPPSGQPHPSTRPQNQTSTRHVRQVDS